nr:jacalin-like lectin [uncultured Allomuricauda sp.]
MKGKPILKHHLFTTFLIGFIFTVNSQSNQCNICSAALSTPMQINFSSYSQFVYTYEEILRTSKSQQELSERSSALGIIAPPYGSLDYQNQKSKYKDLREKFDRDINLKLTDTQKQELSIVMNNPRAYESFDQCIKYCQSGQSMAYYVPIGRNAYEIHVLAKTRTQQRRIRLEQGTIDQNSEFNQGKLRLPVSNKRLRVNRGYIGRFLRKNVDLACNVTLKIEGVDDFYVFDIQPVKKPQQQVPISYVKHKTESKGSNGGWTDFEQQISEHSLQDVNRVSEIRVWHGAYVDAVQVVWEVKNNDGSFISVESEKSGGAGGKMDVIKLADGEEVKSISGRYHNWMDKLIIETTSETYTFGGSGGSWDFTIGFNQSQGNQFYSFHGRTGNLIDRIGIVYRSRKFIDVRRRQVMKIKDKERQLEGKLKSYIALDKLGINAY